MTLQPNYLAWQEKLKTNFWFRRWWQFWSNYSAIFFVLAFLSFVHDQDFLKLLMVSAVGFVLTRGLIVMVINYFYKKQRPYQKYNFSPITSKFFSEQTTVLNSFPSRHLTTLATLTGAMLLFSPIIGWMLLGVTIMTGIARVILGYH